MRNAIFGFIMICLAFTGSPVQAAAEDPSSAKAAGQVLPGGEGLGAIKAVGPSWKSFTNMDGSGLYHEILNSVYGLYGLKVVREYMPSQRARLLVKYGDADVMTCYAGETLDGSWFISALPMYENAYYVFFSKNKIPDWRGPKSLKGRSVAWRIGYYTGKSLPVAVVPKEVKSSEAALGMVLLGRADFYLDDMNLIEESLDASDIPYNRDEYRIEPVGIRKYYPVFSDTPRGRKIRSLYEQGIKRLYDSGELQKIYTKWGHPLPDFPFARGN